MISKKRLDLLQDYSKKELGNLVFRVNACKSCNSSKHEKPMLNWYVEYKKRDPLNLTYFLMQIYVKAEYKYRKSRDMLNETADDCHRNVISQLHLLIDDDSYKDIWKARQGVLM